MPQNIQAKVKCGTKNTFGRSYTNFIQSLYVYIYIYPVDLGLANGFCSLDPQAGACYTKIGQDMLFWVINVINVVFHVTRGKASEQPSMI